MHAKIKENTKYQYSKTPKNKTEIFAVEVFVKIVVNHEEIVFKRMEEMNLNVFYISKNWDINPQKVKNIQKINTKKHLKLKLEYL